MQRLLRFAVPCAVAAFLVAGCGFLEGDRHPTAPTTTTTTNTPTPTPGPAPNPNPLPTDTKMVFDHRGGRPPDPAFPDKANCPAAHEIVISGQVRNATVPQLAPDDTLSGGTLTAVGCNNWGVTVGYANGNPPRYPRTDSTVFATVPQAAGGAVRYRVRGISFNKVAFELILSSDKADINNGLRATQEGTRWWVAGNLAAAQTASLSRIPTLWALLLGDLPRRLAQS